MSETITKMTDFEICESYRNAKKPGEQIKILADLNCCSTEDIFEILNRNNEPLRKRVYNRKTEPKKPAGKTKKAVPKKTVTKIKADGYEIEVKNTLPDEVVSAIRIRLKALNDLVLTTQLTLEKMSNEYKTLTDFLDKNGIEPWEEKSDM